MSELLVSETSDVLASLPLLRDTRQENAIVTTQPTKKLIAWHDIHFDLRLTGTHHQGVVSQRPQS